MRIGEGRPKRVPYSGVAIVRLGRCQYRSRAINVSETGLLLLAPVRGKPGDTVQLKMRFPAISDWFSISGTLVRKTINQGQCAWGIKFGDAGDDVKAMLRQFVQQLLARGPAPQDVDGPAASQPLWTFGIPPRAPRAPSVTGAQPPPLPSKAGRAALIPVPPAPAATPEPENEVMHPSKLSVVVGGALQVLGIRRKDPSSDPSPRAT